MQDKRDYAAFINKNIYLLCVEHIQQAALISLVWYNNGVNITENASGELTELKRTLFSSNGENRREQWRHWKQRRL